MAKDEGILKFVDCQFWRIMDLFQLKYEWYMFIKPSIINLITNSDCLYSFQWILWLLLPVIRLVFKCCDMSVYIFAAMKILTLVLINGHKQYEWCCHMVMAQTGIKSTKQLAWLVLKKIHKKKNLIGIKTSTTSPIAAGEGMLDHWWNGSFTNPVANHCTATHKGA